MDIDEKIDTYPNNLGELSNVMIPKNSLHTTNASIVKKKTLQTHSSSKQKNNKKHVFQPTPPPFFNPHVNPMGFPSRLKDSTDRTSSKNWASCTIAAMVRTSARFRSSSIGTLEFPQVYGRPINQARDGPHNMPSSKIGGFKKGLILRETNGLC